MDIPFPSLAIVDEKLSVVSGFDGEFHSESSWSYCLGHGNGAFSLGSFMKPFFVIYFVPFTVAQKTESV